MGGKHNSVIEHQDSLSAPRLGFMQRKGEKKSEEEAQVASSDLEPPGLRPKNVSPTEGKWATTGQTR